MPDAMTAVSVVGPTHPFKGGIARHTTDLALALQASGREVTLQSWHRQYPKRLYPGEQRVPGDPEGPVFDHVRATMNWFDPSSWVRAGRRAANDELVVIALTTPVQVPPYLVLAGVARAARLVVVCHNVLPHEPGPADRWLVRRLLRRADQVITHTAAQGELAQSLGARSVTVVPLPPHLPTGEERRQEGKAVTRRLLFFGLVRPYKGLSVLLQAVAGLEDVDVTVAGELWQSREELDAEISALDLTSRVELTDGYVDAAELPTVFGRHDALVLPYLDGTASQNVLLAHQLGVPVIASNVGSFPSQIRDGVDGLLVTAGNVEELAAAIRSLYEDDRLEALRAGVPGGADRTDGWQEYVDAVVAS